MITTGSSKITLHKLNKNCRTNSSLRFESGENENMKKYIVSDVKIRITIRINEGIIMFWVPITVPSKFIR